jgi:poly-gamma-glutamate capsule biosynthesis protein CapA/YwtB (metallophosphatase superfamily)
MRLACSLANIVIVSIHWGGELLDWPNKVQRETASWLIKNGADLIIGSHPHVIKKT